MAVVYLRSVAARIVSSTSNESLANRFRFSTVSGVKLERSNSRKGPESILLGSSRSE